MAESIAETNCILCDAVCPISQEGVMLAKLRKEHLGLAGWKIAVLNVKGTEVRRALCPECSVTTES